jgi:hypothetical protein
MAQGAQVDAIDASNNLLLQCVVGGVVFSEDFCVIGELAVES